MAKDWKKLLFASVVIIIIFTTIDFFSHQYLEKNYQLEKVPSYYFQHKVLYGIALLFLTLMFLDNFITLKYYPKIFVTAAIVVLALQFQYSTLYSLRFNYIVLLLHYLILSPLLYIAETKNYL